VQKQPEKLKGQMKRNTTASWKLTFICGLFRGRSSHGLRWAM